MEVFRALLIKEMKNLRAIVEEEEKKFSSMDDIDEMRAHLEKMKKLSREIKNIKHLVDGVENRWLTINQVETFKQIPRKNIQEMIQSRKIKSVKRGNRWYIDRLNLEQYLYNEKKRRAATGILRLAQTEEKKEN